MRESWRDEDGEGEASWSMRWSEAEVSIERRALPSGANCERTRSVEGTGVEK